MIDAIYVSENLAMEQVKYGDRVFIPYLRELRWHGKGECQLSQSGQLDSIMYRIICANRESIGIMIFFHGDSFDR